MVGVEVLTGGDVGKLVLNHSEHLSHRVVDATGELVLVVDCEPAAEHLRNIGLQHLRDAQLVESFLGYQL